MKASPLLRAWLARLDGLGVDFKTRWRWTGGTAFETPEGRVEMQPKVVVLAMGGASWARLGSDGAWAEQFDTAPFKPANMGFVVPWSDHMSEHFGGPLKNIGLRAGAQVVRGEAVISAKGLEGGGIYAVSSAVRDGAELTLDLLPDLTRAEVEKRLLRRRGKNTWSTHLRKNLKLDPVKLALLNEFAHPVPQDPAEGRDAGLGSADGRLLDHRVPCHGALGRTARGAICAARLRRGPDGHCVAAGLCEFETSPAGEVEDLFGDGGPCGCDLGECRL